MTELAREPLGGGAGRQRHPLRHPTIRAYLLLTPMIVLLGLGVLVPLIVFSLYSLWKKVGFDLAHEPTIYNYALALTSSLYMKLIGKAILYGFIVAAVTFVLAYPLAYFVTARVKVHKNAYLIAVLIPLYTGDLVRIFAWRDVLGVSGFINRTLEWMGLISEPIQALLFTPASAVIALTHQYFPFMFLAVWAGLETINFSEVDAARDLGARWFRTFWKVVLPLSLPGVAAGFLFVFTPVTGDYLVSNMMGGPGGITIGNVVVEQFGQADNWPLGAALGVIILVAGLVVLAIFAAFLARLPSIRMYFTKF